MPDPVNLKEELRRQPGPAARSGSPVRQPGPADRSRVLPWN
ncbi:hypothetical protein [Paenibacillus spiritus]|nr:hypothetical protein [Paenibacillus spiritus]